MLYSHSASLHPGVQTFVLETFIHWSLLFEIFRLREIMDQLDSEKSLSVTDVKQELGIAVAMLDKATTAAPLRDYRYGRKL